VTTAASEVTISWQDRDMCIIISGTVAILLSPDKSSQTQDQEDY